jgi:hypothetical protein
VFPDRKFDSICWRDLKWAHAPCATKLYHVEGLAIAASPVSQRVLTTLRAKATLGRFTVHTVSPRRALVEDHGRAAPAGGGICGRDEFSAAPVLQRPMWHYRSHHGLSLRPEACDIIASQGQSFFDESAQKGRGLAVAFV